MAENTEINLSLLHILAIIGSFVGILMITFFISNKSAKNHANIYLAIITLIWVSFYLPTFLFWLGLLDILPHFIQLHIFLTPLIGPFLYFYTCACTKESFKIHPIDYLHFIPFLFLFIYQFPFLILTGSEKIEAFLQFQATNQFHIEGYRIMAVVKTILGIGYFGFCIKLIYDYKTYLPKATSNINTTFHRWLTLYCSSLLIPAFAIIAFVFTAHKLAGYATMFIGIFITLVVTQIAALFIPELFHVFPSPIPAEEKIDQEKQKYKNSNLEATQKEKYIQKLKAFMIQEKPYQAPELTLAQLSEQINIPSYYLSQVINEKLNCNFLDFINSYRVEDAKTKLLDAKLEHYTILAIAYEAGFNSKSTFYSAFKKWTGTTPSKFRKSPKLA